MLKEVSVPGPPGLLSEAHKLHSSSQDREEQGKAPAVLARVLSSADRCMEQGGEAGWGVPEGVQQGEGDIAENVAEP